MTRYLAVLTVAGASLVSLPVHAHHPIADVYDEQRTIVPEGDVTSFLFGNPHSTMHHPTSDVYDGERTIVLEGDVTSFLFGNPHSMVNLRVADPDGGLHTWAVEWRAASRLRRLGWTAADLNVGDRVKVCGNPGRDPGAYRLYLLNVTRILPGAPASDAEDNLCEPAPPAALSAGSNGRPGSSRTTRR